jgi:hypothetical protein
MNKYIKYKNKYLYLKNHIGGFKLNSEKFDNYLYSKVRSYYEKNNSHFNIILDYINFLQCKLLIDLTSDIKLKKQIIKHYDNTFDDNTVDNKTILDINYIYDKIYNILENHHNLLYNYLHKNGFSKISSNRELDNKFIDTTLDEKYIHIETIFNTLNTYINTLINDILDNQDRNELLSSLLITYLDRYNPTNELNIQYAALVFISFILEFELFLLTYSKIPYNYFIGQPYNYGYEKNAEGIIRSDNIIFNNNVEKEWNSHLSVIKPVTRLIYNRKFPSNVLEILKYYTNTLEVLYENFINKFISLLKRIFTSQHRENAEETFNSIVYTENKSKTYDHINHDFYNNFKKYYPSFDDVLHSNITKFISYNHDETKLNYNTSQCSLFDFVFCLNNSHSCISLSLLKIYILFRLRIPYINLLLQSKCSNLLCCSERGYIQDILKVSIEHWETAVNKSYSKLLDFDNKMEININEGHIEVFISYIIYNYSHYIYINNFANIPNDKIKETIKYILTLIITILLNKNKKFLLEIINKYTTILSYINIDELIELLNKDTSHDTIITELTNLVERYKEMNFERYEDMFIIKHIKK